MTWLALLFGLLCAFGGLQTGALAQEGMKFSYPRALERIESLVVSLNESLHRTQEELQEVKLCLNQTKKELGEVQREKESLEATLLETRKELAATKALHLQEIDELRAAQDLSSRVEALEDGQSQVRITMAEQENSVNRLSDSVLTQEHTTSNLTRTVAEQGVCIARLKRDVEEIKIGLRNLSCDNPKSCKELYQCDPTSPTGYYYLRTPQGVRRVYCEMNTSYCGHVRGGWMRVAHINMTDPRQYCPQGLTYVVQSSKRMCIRSQSGQGCSSVTFSQHGVNYTKVCGRARGYQFAGTESFVGHYRYNQSLEGYYVAGLSVTHGSPRNHIWTFAAGASNDKTGYYYHCPCRQYPYAAPAPRFVGENYHCESGWNENTTFYQWHLDDPLWDSRGVQLGAPAAVVVGLGSVLH